MEYPVGWTCEVTVLRLEQYLLRTLPYVDALAVAEHLEACSSCMQRLVLIRSVIIVPGGRSDPGVRQSEGGTRG